MGLKDMVLRKMMERKMKNIPKEQQDKVFEAISKNPDLFQKIALEVQEKMKGGMDQTAATMAVMTKYQDQLKGVL